MTEIMMTELIRSQWSLMGRIEQRLRASNGCERANSRTPHAGYINANVWLSGGRKQNEPDAIANETEERMGLMGRIEQRFRASKESVGVANDGEERIQLMGRIEHITTQQIIGEWGSIENFAASHGVSPASTKMVIYVEGAKSRPVEEALRKYGYLNLLRFEKELKKRGQTFSGYVAADGLNPVELIETLRMKETHPDVVAGLKDGGFWAVLDKGGDDEGDLKIDKKILPSPPFSKEGIKG